tara:strand:+ start:91 stop:474 length:384 start_codon:yes stop_codon:yes gene_type:complete
MAHIEHKLNNSQQNKPYVILTTEDQTTLQNALELKTNRAYYSVTCCKCCGHKVRKKIYADETKPTMTVVAIAKMLGVSRQSIYIIIKQKKIELVQFIHLQKILDCQILKQQSINDYADYLKSLLLSN